MSEFKFRTDIPMPDESSEGTVRSSILTRMLVEMANPSVPVGACEEVPYDKGRIKNTLSHLVAGDYVRYPKIDLKVRLLQLPKDSDGVTITRVWKAA